MTLQTHGGLGDPGSPTDPRQEEMVEAEVEAEAEVEVEAEEEEEEDLQ